MKIQRAFMAIVIVTGLWGCGGPSKVISAVGNSITISFTDQDAIAGHGEAEAAYKAQRYCQTKERNAELSIRSGEGSGVNYFTYR